MHCPRCGCENRTGAKFCNECAVPLPLHCNACGAENRPGARFCDACGTALATPPPASSRQQPDVVTLAPLALAPIAYTPAHLTEKIRHATAALAGERKQVTVLFADLKGSMELLADRATPYLPVLDLLKAYCGIEARDEARRVREKLTGKLLTLDAALGSALPAVLSLLEVPVDDPAWQGLDPAQRRQRTLEAVKRLLLRESQVQPVLLICEDLHWIDAETQALLESLVDSLPTARIVLLVNYRPEYQHGWGGKT